jgi:AcrR family transcriptional regulator
VTRSVGRPKAGDASDTRRDILRAAEESFAGAGFAGASTRKVALAAGVNVATLHEHFGCKEGLSRAVREAISHGELPALRLVGTRGERLARLVRDLYDFTAARPTLSRLALLDILAGPRPRNGDGQADGDDPRVAALRDAMTELFGGAPEVRADEAARSAVTLIDATLLGSGPEKIERLDGGDEAALRSGEPARGAVVAAALALVGLTDAPPPLHPAPELESALPGGARAR